MPRIVRKIQPITLPQGFLSIPVNRSRAVQVYLMTGRRLIYRTIPLFYFSQSY